MRRPLVAVSLIVLASLGVAPAADPPLIVDIWPNKIAPGDNTRAIEAERTFEAPPRKTEPDVPYRVAGKPCKLITNVTQPTLTICRPAKDRDTGVAMLICPGGGYHALYWDLHGEEVAEWLNRIGVTGIIVKYRCPRRPGEEKTEPSPRPLEDAQRAVSLVRSRAKEWGIDPQKIGMVGFSAGGHLVGATATSFDRRSYTALDDVDKISCRPDFGVMLYSGYLQAKGKDELTPTMRVPANTPPMLLIHATDDPVSAVENSVVLYRALRRAGVSTEMHLYATGGHPFGVRQRDLPCDKWPKRCEEWLRQLAILK